MTNRISLVAIRSIGTQKYLQIASATAMSVVSCIASDGMSSEFGNTNGLKAQIRIVSAKTIFDQGNDTCVY